MYLDFPAFGNTQTVTGDLCRNHADDFNQKIEIQIRKKCRSVKARLFQQKLENWNLKSRNVKVETCQQKLEKQKRESWNLATET